MNLQRFASSLLVAAALTGCGGSSVKTAKVPVGEMPEGETWSGVYFHPVYGFLHMQEEGGSVVGRWKRADQSAWGELSGAATGNVLHFQWREHKIGLVGPSATTKGRGYFAYKMDTTNNIGNFEGQFGLNEDELGASWNCVKQQRMQPDLKSIGGDTGAAPRAAETWE